MQPGAVNAVRPKRKKKKQASIQQPVQALPQLSVQPMMAFNAPPQVPQLGLGGSAPPMAVPQAAMVPSGMVPQVSGANALDAPQTQEQVKAKKRVNAGSVRLIHMPPKIALLSTIVLFVIMRLIPLFVVQL
jgi:hypothetical protein